MQLPTWTNALLVALATWPTMALADTPDPDLSLPGRPSATSSTVPDPDLVVRRTGERVGQEVPDPDGIIQAVARAIGHVIPDPDLANARVSRDRGLPDPDQGSFTVYGGPRQVRDDIQGLEAAGLALIGCGLAASGAGGVMWGQDWSTAGVATLAAGMVVTLSGAVLVIVAAETSAEGPSLTLAPSFVPGPASSSGWGLGLTATF